ncbi:MULTISPECIES: DUF6624 domain-containing protein [unclassified Chryseobacterium]|uniref:DUF6624 domain-containing protein n=1 Tax=unclassified Chryseobacterium TaxID=2593645 RepID=UPI000F45246F|nr:DUF6624 domain-containing protein [Chryseobacterium sp. G0240]ROI04994.1 hypothetical protein EGI16_06625 [Chryseobacterium sp. G0240]
MNENFSKELTALAETDLSVREKLAATGALFNGYHPEMERVHKANAKRLREIIAEIGFPTIANIGEEGSEAAWLIIQHSIAEPEFMKECYQRMVENSRDINPKHRAYLYDRIQVFQSRPQKYGTQISSDGRLYPVEDKSKVNEERINVTLPPLSHDVISKIPEAEQIPEIDARDSEYMIWRKKVGWI